MKLYSTEKRVRDLLISIKVRQHIGIRQKTQFCVSVCTRTGSAPMSL